MTEDKIDCLKGTLDLLVPRRSPGGHCLGGVLDNQRAKYYRLIRSEQRQLKAKTEDWQGIPLTIANALQET
jgi:hypothetical protein